MRWVLGVVLLIGCSDPTDTSNTQPSPCKLDSECGKGRYCGPAGVCRSDCTTDAHCYGPSTTAQCNAQGRCVETVDAASPPTDDTGPADVGVDAGAETAPLEAGG